eukprot:COSAG02_NODE_2613_length_8415_cov_189.763829_2_plen_39_part_00
MNQFKPIFLGQVSTGNPGQPSPLSGHALGPSIARAEED